MNDKYPFVQVEPQQLLAETAHLTLEQWGAVTKLLSHLWIRGGKLRDNGGELAQIVGVSLRRWEAMRSPVMELFQIADGEITHHCVVAGRERIQRLVEKNRERANRRWHPEGDAAAMPRQYRNDANYNHNKSLPSTDGAGRVAVGQTHLPLGPVPLKPRGIRE